MPVPIGRQNYRLGLIFGTEQGSFVRNWRAQPSVAEEFLHMRLTVGRLI